MSTLLARPMRPKILLADDDRVAAQAIASMLSAAGYDVLSAQDAMQAVMQAVRGEPDVILLDIAMPGGGAEQVLTRLKASSKTSAIPVVVISALPERDLESRSKSMGIDLVLRKPVNADQLKDAIERALESRPPTDKNRR